MLFPSATSGQGLRRVSLFFERVPCLCCERARIRQWEPRSHRPQKALSPEKHTHHPLTCRHTSAHGNDGGPAFRMQMTVMLLLSLMSPFVACQGRPFPVFGFLTLSVPLTIPFLPAFLSRYMRTSISGKSASHGEGEGNGAAVRQNDGAAHGGCQMRNTVTETPVGIRDSGDDELVPAVTGEETSARSTEILKSEMAAGSQQLIARDMAVSVVDILEIVHDEQSRPKLLSARFRFPHIVSNENARSCNGDCSSP